MSETKEKKQITSDIKAEKKMIKLKAEIKGCDNALQRCLNVSWFDCHIERCTREHIRCLYPNRD